MDPQPNSGISLAESEPALALQTQSAVAVELDGLQEQVPVEGADLRETPKSPQEASFAVASSMLSEAIAPAAGGDATQNSESVAFDLSVPEAITPAVVGKVACESAPNTIAVAQEPAASSSKASPERDQERKDSTVPATGATSTAAASAVGAPKARARRHSLPAVLSDMPSFSAETLRLPSEAMRYKADSSEKSTGTPKTLNLRSLATGFRSNKRKGTGASGASDSGDSKSSEGTAQSKSHKAHISRNDELLQKMPSTKSRRVVNHIDAEDLHAEGPKIDLTKEVIDKMLDDEAERLSSKATSRSYQNDRRQVSLERELAKSPRHKKSKKPKAKSGSKVQPHAGELYNVGPPTGDEEIGENEQADETDAPSRIASGTLRRDKAEAQQKDNLRYIGRVSPMKWAVTVLVAFLISAQAGMFIIGTYQIGHWKLDVVGHLCSSGNGNNCYLSFFFLLGYGLPCCLFSACLVTYIAPFAGGSGIPEVKSYLNGISTPAAFSFRTWACRSTGLVLVTSSGLFAGTEGPFAHLGGIIAASFSEGPSWRGKKLWPSILHGHRNQCEFMAQGCAMGVAAAFGAPVGGILFSLEEASTFWSKELTWQAFLGTMIAAVFAKLTKSGFTSVNAAGFIEFPDRTASFELWELITFGLLAVLNGLMGAFFCGCVKRTIAIRKIMFSLGSPTRASKRARVAEVSFVVVFTMIVIFWIPMAFGCEDLIIGASESLQVGEPTPPDISGGICPEGSYSELGHLLLSPKEHAIKVLFSRSMAQGATLNISSLLVCYVIIILTTLLTFGAALPVGLFIPNILAGACLGRAVAQALLEFGYELRPDVYALMGAAGALAGFSRMTISLAVIFLEITNNMYMLMPLMLVIMTSKFIGDRFNPSVYDIVLESRPNVNLLEDDLSEDHCLILDGITAHDVCAADVVIMREFETLPQVLSLLMQTKYDGYPVVDPHNRLVGLVSRAELLVAVGQYTGESSKFELVPIHSFVCGPPSVTLWNTPATQAFRHFQALGLQHLCVVSETHEFLGILTRTDMARLCHHGHEGAEVIRELITRKQQACTDGKMATVQRPDPAQPRRMSLLNIPADMSDSHSGSHSQSVSIGGSEAGDPLSGSGSDHTTENQSHGAPSPKTPSKQGGDGT